jgi:hypothetical protein
MRKHGGENRFPVVSLYHVRHAVRGLLANEKKSHLAVAFLLNLAETVGFEPTIQV